MTSDTSANIEQFSGSADCYDRYRPEPPAVLLDILTQLAQRRTSAQLTNSQTALI